MEGLTVAVADLMVYVHPSKANKVRRAVLRQLSSLLFTPNMLLEGKVVKLGKESIHVIVLGFSSAAIMLEDIRGEFKYKIKHGVEVFASMSHKRHVIRIGSMIRFLVKSLDEEILHISGSLVPPHTGCIRWLSKHAVENESHLDRSLMNVKDAKRELLGVGTIDSAEGDKLLNPTRPHNSKKRTREDRSEF